MMLGRKGEMGAEREKDIDGERALVLSESLAQTLSLTSLKRQADLYENGYHQAFYLAAKQQRACKCIENMARLVLICCAAI